jgi:hypothetical protein
MDQMSLRNERALTQLLADFDRLQKEEEGERKTASGGYKGPRMCDSPESNSPDWPPNNAPASKEPEGTLNVEPNKKDQD